jgi:hypothetical protein
VLGEGENLTDQQANDALDTLNEIVEKWNNESLMIIGTNTIEFNLTNKKSYTIGTSGDIDTLRPPSGVMSCYYIMNGNTSVPIQLITEVQYNAITLKDLEINYPTMAYYSPSYPLAELFVYPISNEGKIVLTVSDQFIKFETLDTVIDLPSGYIKALRYNLAVEQAIEYGRVLSQDASALAVSAKAAIKVTNGSQRLEIMVTDPALRRSGGFNIYTGD